MADFNYELLDEFIKHDSLDMIALTKQFNVSAKTILNRIHNLNESLTGVAEIKVNNQRYHLKVYDFQKLTDIQTNYLKSSLNLNNFTKRRAIILQHLLFAQDFVTLDDLSEAVYVSKATLNRDIKQIKRELQAYQAHIVSAPNHGICLQIKTDWTAGLLLAHWVYDYCNLIDAFASTGTRTHFKHLMQPIDAASYSKVAKNVNILANLIPRKLRLEHGSPQYLDLLDYAKLQPVIQYVEQILHTQLTTAELQFLFYPLAIKATSVLDPVKVEQAIQELRPLFEQITQKIKTQMDVSLNFPRLFQQIKYHLIFLINRALFKVQLDDSLNDEIMEKYPVALELALITTQTIEQDLQLSIVNSENSYLAVYYQMELNAAPNEQPVKTVAIVGHISSGVKKFITQQLHDLFQTDIQIKSFTDAAAFQASTEDFLIAFSDVPIATKDKAFPIVRSSNIFRTTELVAKVLVAQVYKEIRDNNCYFTIKAIASQDGYWQATYKMIEEQIAIGQLNEDFLDNWQQRERQTNNVFENAIALPHAIDTSKHQRIFFEIGVFDHSVDYNNGQVRIVFLIGIPSKLDQELQRTLATLYDMIATISQNKEMYQNLLNYDPQQSLMQITEGI